MNPSERIDQLIAELTDWRGKTLAGIRKSILEADREIVEEWKWRGSPVWSRDGIIAVGNAHKDKVKLTFSHGASLPDPERGQAIRWELAGTVGDHLCGSVKYVSLDADGACRVCVDHRNHRIFDVKIRSGPDLQGISRERNNERSYPFPEFSDDALAATESPFNDHRDNCAGTLAYKLPPDGHA